MLKPPAGGERGKTNFLPDPGVEPGAAALQGGLSLHPSALRHVAITPVRIF